MKNEYRKGYAILAMSVLIWKLEKGEYVYLRDKLMHPSFILNMPLKAVIKALEKGEIIEAIIGQQKEHWIDELVKRNEVK